MKVYSIGRDVGCDIVINDNTDVVSRRHATLNVASSGKMTIVDSSYNGTYVNGIRISPNVPVPVTRKDNVSFAHVARLDWNLIPKSRTPLYYALAAVVAIIIVVGVVIGFNAMSSDHSTTGGTSTTAVTDSVKKDTVKTDTAKNEKPKEQPATDKKAKPQQKDKKNKKEKDSKDNKEKGKGQNNTNKKGGNDKNSGSENKDNGNNNRMFN